MPAARRILIERDIDGQIDRDLCYIARVDQAHTIMLAECGIIRQDQAARLLRAIQQLQRDRFLPVRKQPFTRGLDFAYEDYLIATEGVSVGGVLHTGRSRNDVNATTLKLRLRQPYLDVDRKSVV